MKSLPSHEKSTKIRRYHATRYIAVNPESNYQPLPSDNKQSNNPQHTMHTMKK